MIYVTGDTHGNFERIEEFCEQVKTSKDDIMIILGDAGINYYCGIRDVYKKQRLSELPITLFCIHGNHEMRPGNLPCYHTTEWHGGQVYIEDDYPNLLFAMDGEVYDLGGIDTLVIGGAYSVDKAYRLAAGFSWWPDEQPSQAVRDKVDRVLHERDWKIDVVLSHTVPLKYEPTEVFLSGIDQSRVDKSTEQWLDTIEDRLCYERWFCGHYHTYKEVNKVCILYENILEFTVKGR